MWLVSGSPVLVLLHPSANTLSMLVGPAFCSLLANVDMMLPCCLASQMAQLPWTQKQQHLKRQQHQLQSSQQQQQKSQQ